ncbi:MAG: LAGLIDADG family homing endonuclease [Candidatus Hadarchaeaceae archaeon]
MKLITFGEGLFDNWLKHHIWANLGVLSGILSVPSPPNPLRFFFAFCIGDKMFDPETEVKQTNAIFELVGVLLGDGYVYYKPPHHHIEISGNATDDRPYLENYLSKLLQNLVSKEIHLYEHYDRKGKSIRLTVYSKELVTYLINEIGLVYGKKKAEIAEIPKQLFRARWNKTKLILRGFVDTDGCLFFCQKGTYKKHSYPMIEMRSASPKLLNQFQNLLQSNGFNPRLRSVKSRYKSKASYLYLSGEKQLSKWIYEIGFRNPKHMTKYQVWKQIGYCSPGTALKERLQKLTQFGLINLHQPRACYPI